MKIEIECDGKASFGKVVLDGKDVSNMVNDVELRMQAGEPVKVLLALVPLAIRTVIHDVEILEYRGLHGERLISDPEQ
jgi:hypothetical protein